MNVVVDAKDLFEILIRENASMLTAFLRSAMSDNASIDDLFQETLLTAWRRLDTYDKTRPFGPWLRGIAANLLYSHYRKTSRQGLSLDEQQLEYLNQRFEQWHQLPGDTFDQKLDALRLCLSQLPDTYREPIYRRYQDNLGIAAIADKLGLAAEAIKKRLHRGRARLLECIQRRLESAGVQA